ncbi:MAG: hypothetical protein U0805_06345 [Pirellulales bacterium]
MDAGIAGAEITIGEIGGHRLGGLVAKRVAGPGPIVAMRGDDDPFFTQRMPALFPVFGAGNLTPGRGGRLDRSSGVGIGRHGGVYVAERATWFSTSRARGCELAL